VDTFDCVFVCVHVLHVCVDVLYMVYVMVEWSSISTTVSLNLPLLTPRARTFCIGGTDQAPSHQAVESSWWAS